MSDSEKFKKWLAIDYGIISVIQYATGIKALNEMLGLENDGIFSRDSNLEDIAVRINQIPNLPSRYRTHFKRYLEFRKKIDAEQILQPLVFRQTDIFKRQQVEITAINEVVKFYRQQGYNVKSVEKDNVGWDLEAKNSEHTLYIEVKGLSGKSMTIELSSNEFKKSKSTENYKICIITNALKNPILNIFHFDKLIKKWKNEKGETLSLTTKISAILSLEK